MTKEELILYICTINKSVEPEFLLQFSAEELNDYLNRLVEV